MLQARDVMTEEVICVRKDTPVIEAIQTMVTNKITGVPVVDEDMTLVGILSAHDVLRLFHSYKQEQDRTAGEFMTKNAIHVEEHDRLLDVCFRLLDCSIRRVPVTSDGKVKGIISRADILKCILRLSQGTCHASSG